MRISLRITAAMAALAVSAVLMGLLAGVFEEKISPNRLAPQSVPADGPLAEARLHHVPQIEQAVGTFRPKLETKVASRVLANVVAVNVHEGELVEEGDALVELDRRELTARVEQARQEQAAAQAAVEEARSGFKRVSELADRGVAAAVELDRARAALKTAEAQLLRARRGLEEIEATRSFTTVRAPISGRVIHRLIEPGDTATPGGTLLHLYDPRSLRLEAHVRETIATRLSLGDRLDVQVDASRLKLPAIVEEVVPAADPGSRSFIVKAAVPALPDLYPGMFGRLLIPTGREEHVSVPAEAIRRVGQLEYVMVVTDDHVLRRYVRIGVQSHEGRVEVLSGLRPGEQVVLPARSSNVNDNQSGARI